MRFFLFFFSRLRFFCASSQASSPCKRELTSLSKERDAGALHRRKKEERQAQMCLSFVWRSQPAKRKKKQKNSENTKEKKNLARFFPLIFFLYFSSPPLRRFFFFFTRILFYIFFFYKAREYRTLLGLPSALSTLALSSFSSVNPSDPCS